MQYVHDQKYSNTADLPAQVHYEFEPFSELRFQLQTFLANRWALSRRMYTLKTWLDGWPIDEQVTEIVDAWVTVAI